MYIFSVVVDFGFTNIRNQVISFMDPIDGVIRSLFIKTPANTFNYTAYFDPFNFMVWVCVGIFGFITAPFLFLSTQ